MIKKTYNAKLEPKRKLPEEFINSLEKCKRNINADEWDDINLCLLQNRYFIQNVKDNAKVTNQPLLMELLGKKSVSFAMKHDFKHKDVKYHMVDLLVERRKRNYELIKSFPEHNMYETKFYGRVILGEGGLTPFSNVVQLKLHPLYGIPYVPASSIKGGLRACWHDLYAGLEDENKKQIEVELFGTAEENGQEGKLIFFDAFPTEFILTKDIETPHFQDYYTDANNGKQPTDDHSPIPITIICMEKVTLLIPMACRDQALWNKQKENIDKALKKMIEEFGIGAKTALGYGMGTMEGISR